LNAIERGSVITVAAGGGMGHKPRPAIVVQSDDYSQSDTLIIVPLTGETRGEAITRPIFSPDDSNGLQQVCRMMTNRIMGVPIANVGKVVGKMSPEDLERVDAALSLILGLDRA
jgi:mRNA interferase MazF